MEELEKTLKKHKYELSHADTKIRSNEGNLALEKQNSENIKYNIAEVNEQVAEEIRNINKEMLL